MKKKIILGLIVLVVIVMAVMLSNREKENVKIGAVLSLSGDGAVDGENIKAGIDFAKKELAKDGIILDVVYENDGTEPAKTVSAINKVVEIDNVDAIVGPTWSFLASAAVTTIQDKQIVAYNPAVTSEYVEGNSEYLLFGAPKNAFKEAPTTEWINSINANRVAIVLEQGAWGDSHITPFESAIENANAELVMTERIPFTATGQDIQTIISKLKQNNVEAVLFTGFDASTAVFINKVDELYPELSILAATEIAKKQNEDGTINVSEEDDVYVLIPATSEKFKNDFEKEYGKLPGSYTDTAYDGTMLLAKAIANKPEGVELNDYIRELDYTGYMGDYKFDDNNDVLGREWVIEQLK